MKIPFEDLEPMLAKYGLRQLIVVAWDGQETHVATHGKTISDGDQAADGGNFVKLALGWPEHLCEDTSARVADLQSQLATTSEHLLVALKALRAAIRISNTAIMFTHEAAIDRWYAEVEEPIEDLLLERKNSGDPKQTP
jgi:hypothetical protein